MGSSSGSDSDDSKHSKKEKKVKVKKADKEDKSDKEGKSDKEEGKSDKPKKEKKDKEKSKDKDKEKSKDKDKEKGKDKEHKEGKEDKAHKEDKKESKESKHEAPGVGKIPGVAGVLLGAAISGLSGGKREAPPGGSSSGAEHGSSAQASGHLDASKLPSHCRQLSTTGPLPPPDQVGFAACTDVGGDPLFLVLAPYDGGLHPGKMVIRTGSTHGEVYFAHKGHEIVHQGDYALVPFDPAKMQWVPSPRGVLPSEYKAVDGGHEADGTPLYFALGVVDGGRVPGKASSKLGGAQVALGGKEVATETAEILCWR